MSTRHLALIGAGYWGKNLARNFNALGALHTLCDLSPEILASYGDDYAEVKKTGEEASLWSDPAITQVAIAAPAAHHYRLAKAAILAGKDVYVEKPLCLDIAEAEELVALARERRRILMVGHLLQYHPMVRQLQTWANEGTLGEIQYISSHRLSLGKFRREENVLWSFAPHDLSVILSLAGDSEPGTVTCQGGSYLSPNVEDMTITQLAFAGGLKAHVYANWLNPIKEQKLTVIGSKATAVFDDTKPWAEKLAIYRGVVEQGANGPVPHKTPPEYAVVAEAEPLREECRHFLDCCCDRTPPRTDGAEGLRVLRVLQAAQADLEARRK
jgi:UDP-2-acetamido-3-amino-2,3-dideoxy-glucuronate N-acetyltransferase